MYIIQDREAGNYVDGFNTIEEAQEVLAKYEEQDKKDWVYVEDCYEIVDAEGATSKMIDWRTKGTYSDKFTGYTTPPIKDIEWTIQVLLDTVNSLISKHRDG